MTTATAATGEGKRPLASTSPLARRRRVERGSVTLELAVVFPALLLVILTIVQAGLWYHGRNLALAAAQEGVRAGRAEHATPAQGEDAARRFLADQAGDTLTHTSVSAAGSSPTEIRIRVTGQALTVLPGLRIQVSQQARAPRERFTTRGDP